MPKSCRELLLSNYDLCDLSYEYINNIDSILGFSYYNEYFRELHLKMSPRSLICKTWGIDQHDRVLLTQKKMKFASDNLINLGSVHGPLERLKMYIFIINQICDRTEKRIKDIHLSGNQNSRKINIDFCYEDNLISYVEEKDNGVYLLRKKD